jgi:hypothetical protein
VRRYGREYTARILEPFLVTGAYVLERVEWVEWVESGALRRQWQIEFRK